MQSEKNPMTKTCVDVDIDDDGDPSERLSSDDSGEWKKSKETVTVASCMDTVS